jgi:hypothetical protein
MATRLPDLQRGGSQLPRHRSGQRRWRQEIVQPRNDQGRCPHGPQPSREVHGPAGRPRIGHGRRLLRQRQRAELALRHPARSHVEPTHRGGELAPWAQQHQASREAVRIHLGPEVTPHRMKNSLLSMARELGIPVTIRRVPGGLLFWRSTDEDRQQAKETGTRFQNAHARQKTRPNSRRRAPPTRTRGSS